MIRFIFLFSFLSLFLSVQQVWAQAPGASQKIDSLFEMLVRHDKIWGSAAIRTDSQTTYQRAVGFAVKSLKYANPNTQYRIGSISKVYTATMILQLVEEGKLSLEDPISIWFPKMVNADSIRIRNLLQHSSGIHNFTNDLYYYTYYTEPQPRDSMLKKFEALPSDFKPGEKNEYSNTNYCLLGYLVEMLDKRSYNASLQERIAEPLGLKATRHGGKIDLDANQALSYKWTEEGWEEEPSTDMSIPHGAGAIVSTAEEVCIFFESLFEGKLLKPETLDQMCALENGFGLGIFQVPFKEKKAWFHSGGIDGFQSNAAYFPEEKVAVAFLGNGVHYDMNKIMIGLLSYQFGEKYELPSFTKAALSEAQLDLCEGLFKSDILPIEIKVWREGKQLMGQATRQKAVVYEAESENVFHYEQAGITLIFKDLKDGHYQSMVFKQGGASVTFERE